MQIKPSHVVFLALAGAFGVLLYLEGWTLPLKIVAGMLPLAGFLVFA